ESFAKSNGYLGRSWGCPAVSTELAKPVIDKIKNGSVVYSYHSNEPRLA
ncbi:MAG: murein L,D-transpeptidase catalytic domain family protein, partial [Gammaproteobacteria bacterium]